MVFPCESFLFSALFTTKSPAMNRRLAPVAVALSVISIGTAMFLIAGTQRSALELLDPSLNDISSAFSETDRASQVLSKEGGLSLVGRDYEVFEWNALLTFFTVELIINECCIYIFMDPTYRLRFHRATFPSRPKAMLTPLLPAPSPKQRRCLPRRRGWITHPTYSAHPVVLFSAKAPRLLPNSDPISLIMLLYLIFTSGTTVVCCLGSAQDKQRWTTP